MPTFDRNSGKFELFEDPFQTTSKLHSQLTDEDNIDYFHSLMRGDALNTFKGITRHQPQQREIGRDHDCFPQEILQTPITGDGETQFLIKRTKIYLIFQPTPEISQGGIRSCRSSNQRETHTC